MQALCGSCTTCAGEIHEYKEDLASLDKSKKKDAVKKVIAAMTVGKDVSMLFPHVGNTFVKVRIPKPVRPSCRS